MRRWVPGLLLVLALAALGVLWQQGYFAGGGTGDADTGSTNDTLDLLDAEVEKRAVELTGSGSLLASWLPGIPEGERDFGRGPAALRGSVRNEAGAPLGGAVVEVVVVGLDSADRALRTRADGTFNVKGLPTGIHIVVASQPGYRTQSKPTPALEDTGEVELEPFVLLPRVDRRSTIEVLATDLAGRALEGVKILATTMPWNMHMAAGPEAVGLDGVRHRSGLTDADGRLSLEGLEPDLYNIVATAPGMAVEQRERFQVSPESTKRVVLRLMASTTIRGRMVDAAEQPVAGGMVMGFLQPQFESSVPTTTQADGSFLIDGVKPGAYLIVGYSEDSGSSMSPGKAPGEGLVLRMAGAGRVEGTVVDTAGKPVSAGHVRPWQSTYFGYYYSQIHPLSAEGKFSVALPKGDWNFRAELPDGSVSNEVKVSVETAGTAQVELRVPERLVVRGTVVDDAGNHIEGAQVFLMVGGFPPTPSREHHDISDPEGAFEVAGLEPGAISLHVVHPDYSAETVSATPAAAGGASPVRVVLRPGGTIRGRLVDAMDQPIAGERIAASPEGSYMEFRTTGTAADGSFVLTPLDAGTWTVGLGLGAATAVRERVVVAAGSSVDVLLRVPESGGTLTGIVKVGGVPTAGIEVVVADARGPTSGKATSDAEGRFRVEGLAVGPIAATAVAGGNARGRASATLAGETPTADVTIDIGTAALRATIVDADGLPASGVWSHLQHPDAVHAEESGWVQLPQTGADGRIEAAGLAPGRYTLQANEEAHAHFTSQPFDLREGATVDLGTLVLRRAVEVRGRVVDDAGSAVENAAISVHFLDGRPAFMFSIATTGSDGRYVLRGIEAGTYRMGAEARGLAPATGVLVNVDGAGTVADFVLARGGGIQFSVESDTGEPIGGARLSLFDGAGRPVTRTLSLANFNDTGRRYTDPQGKALIDDLAPGAYRIEAVREGWVQIGGHTPTSVASGVRTPLRIVLSAQAPPQPDK